MRSIDSVRLSVSVPKGTAFLRLSIVENGKTLPFRDEVKHTLLDGTVNSGCLAAVATEEEAKEQFAFHLAQAQKKGWSQALPGRMKILAGIPDPPREEGDETQPVAPMELKRRPGRPRKIA